MGSRGHRRWGRVACCNRFAGPFPGGDCGRRFTELGCSGSGLSIGGVWGGRRRTGSVQRRNNFISANSAASKKKRRLVVEPADTGKKNHTTGGRDPKFGGENMVFRGL